MLCLNIAVAEALLNERVEKAAASAVPDVLITEMNTLKFTHLMNSVITDQVLLLRKLNQQ